MISGSRIVPRNRVESSLPANDGKLAIFLSLPAKTSKCFSEVLGGGTTMKAQSSRGVGRMHAWLNYWQSCRKSEAEKHKIPIADSEVNMVD